MIEASSIQALQNAIWETNAEVIIELLAELPHSELRDALTERATHAFAALAAEDEETSEAAEIELSWLLPGMAYVRSESILAFVRDAFGKIARLPCERYGSVVESLAAFLAGFGADDDLRLVARSHAMDARLKVCFVAALWSLDAQTVFDEYSPYMLKDPGEKWAIRDDLEFLVKTSGASPAEMDRINVQFHSGRFPAMWSSRPGVKPELDPRWLDVAIETDRLEYLRLPVVSALLRKGYQPLNDHLLRKFNSLLDEREDLDYIISAMIEVEHPDLVECSTRGAEMFIIPADEDDIEEDELIEDEDDDIDSGCYIDSFAYLMAQFPSGAADIDEWVETLPEPTREAFRTCLEKKRKKYAPQNRNGGM